jgi:hypothetical protein
MCIVCQNAPTMMTALAGGGLVIRTAIRRARDARSTDAAVRHADTAVAGPSLHVPVVPTPRA